MKNIYIIIFLIASFTTTSIAQTDSVLKTKDATISYFRIYKYKNQDSDSIFQRGGFAELTGIKFIKFLNNDSLIAKNDENYIVGLKTNKIKEIKISKEGGEIVTGVVFGGLAGCSLGLMAAYIIEELSKIGSMNLSFGSGSYHASNKDEDHTELNMILGGVIGTVIGSVIGAAIAYSAGYETLDLFSIPDKDKKARLIKFLRQK
jgi:hypothetical protein